MRIRFIALIAALVSTNLFATTIVEDLQNQNRRLQKIIDKNNVIIKKKLGGGGITDETALITSAPVRKNRVSQDTTPDNNYAAPAADQLSLMSDLNQYLGGLPKRAIPQSFIVGTGISTIDGKTAPVDTYNYTGQQDILYIAPTLMVGWQALDNLWIEGSYARRVATNVPVAGLDVTYETLAMRFKYNYQTPWFNINLQPYMGFQATLVDAPGLGENNSQNPFLVDQAKLQREKDYIENQKENKLILGVTVIKPFMKSFFVRGDLGTDWRSASLGMLF
ncbi:MAG: hypothetical protein EP326_15340 [Deltaproteobacteria bacterium]|nr:MAG: hypothetical protein EP326_15340 [Deltaproteobacteria bacterium]TNF25524.1 MAG: hypothetical protein EP319_15980 [Deltaproteobacteria bacterium]